jgi:hypothetical protein
LAPLLQTFSSLCAAAVFTFGVVAALSLAHEVPSGGPIHTIALKNLMKSGPVRMDMYAFALALEDESWSVPRSTQPALKERQAVFYRRIEPLKQFSLAETNTPKVSLQILKSVLLI